MKKKLIFVTLATLTVVLSSISKLNAATPSDHGLKEGDLISAIFSDDPDVYIINEQGYKRLFLNPEIFKFYSHLGGFFNVKLVTKEVINSFPTSGLFRDCESNDQKVYGMDIEGEDTGQLHWVNTTGSQAIKDDPDFFKKVFCINKKEFDWYPKAISFNSVIEVPKYDRIVETTTASTQERLEAKAETKNIGKVIICHYPPENIQAHQTLTVDASALKAHLDHGDTVGACLTPTPLTSPGPSATPTLTPIPNIGISPSPIASVSYSPTPIPTQTASQSYSPTPTPTPSTSSGLSTSPTPATTPTAIYNTRPVISSVLASSITSNSVVISWTTDVPATGFVNYGSTPTNWIVSPENTSLTTQHSFTISNLAATTLYNYRVYSHNAYGDQTDLTNGYPPNRTFTTSSGSVSCSNINLTLNDGKITYIKGVDNIVNYTWICTPSGSANVNIGIQKPGLGGWVSLNTTTNSSTQTLSIDISGASYPVGTYRLEACFNVCGSIVAGQTFSISSPTPTPTPTPTPSNIPSGAVVASDGTWCYDSDGFGTYAYIKGYCQDNSGKYWDYCDSNAVKDYYCMASSGITTIKCTTGRVECSNVYACSDGVCVAVSSTPTPTPTTSSVSYNNFSKNIAGVFTRDLYFGSIGNEVKQLQTLLVNEVGYSSNLITGYFGSITQNAVKRLQEKYGVKPVSGYFGAITRKALNALISN